MKFTQKNAAVVYFPSTPEVAGEGVDIVFPLRLHLFIYLFICVSTPLLPFFAESVCSFISVHVGALLHTALISFAGHFHLS